MKNKLRNVLIILFVVAMTLSVVACGGNGDGTTNPTKKDPTSLTPNSIKVIADLPNYGKTAADYTGTAVDYETDEADYITYHSNLENRIQEKAEEVATQNPFNEESTVTSISKIFSQSDATTIIERMGLAGLTQEEMYRVVNYLAGDPDAEVNSEVINDVATKWQRIADIDYDDTEGWSFFDDYDLYNELEDRSEGYDEGTDDKNNASDAVKHQYRNMCRKVFEEVGLAGDEFARMVVEELRYAIEILEGGQSSNSIGTESFLTATKPEYDYDNIAYLLTFNEMDNADEYGQKYLVKLYGYYYNYTRIQYESMDDPTFAKQLKYSHQEVYTNKEWLDYTKIQRDAYEDAYRYSDDFYQDEYLPNHYAFQAELLVQEDAVYGTQITSDKSSTSVAYSQNGLEYFDSQLNMSDWEWCYGADDKAMTAYNEAQTKLHDTKDRGGEPRDEAEFKFNQENLKMNGYLLENMKAVDLSNSMRYQVYSYSANMATQIQSLQKSKVNIEDEKIFPEFYVYYRLKANKERVEDNSEVTLEDMQTYSKGKIDEKIKQIKDKIQNFSTDDKADEIAGTSWSSIQEELETTMDMDSYSDISEAESEYWGKMLQKQEDLLIKKTYVPKAPWTQAKLDEIGVTYGSPVHYKEEYDADHEISKFANNNMEVLRYSSAQSEISFRAPLDETKVYNMPTADISKSYFPGVGGNISKDIIDNITGDVNSYTSQRELIFTTAENFETSLNNSTDLTKDYNELVEANKLYRSKDDTITMSLVGWYYDADLLYQFETKGFGLAFDWDDEEHEYSRVRTGEGWEADPTYIIGTMDYYKSFKPSADVDSDDIKFVIDVVENDLTLYAGYEGIRNS